MSQAKTDAKAFHRFTLNITKGNYEWVRKAAHKGRMSISQMINQAVSDMREKEKRA